MRVFCIILKYFFFDFHLHLEVTVRFYYSIKHFLKIHKGMY